MSTPSSTPGSTTPPVASAAGLTAKAEVVKKNSLRFSPANMDTAHKLYEQGFTYAAIDVVSGAVVKGFTNELECQEFCEVQNAK